MDGINIGAGGGASDGGNANPGNAGGSPGAGSGQGGSPGSPPSNIGNDFWSGISTENRQFAESKGVKGLGDLDKLFGSHRELERTFNSRGPNNGNKQQYRLSDYEFKSPDNAQELGIDDKLITGFKQFAQSKGVDPQIASEFFDYYATQSQGSFKSFAEAQSAAVTKSVADAQAALVQEWGDTKSPQFSRNVELAKRAMNNLDPGFKEALIEMGAIKTVNGKSMVANANVFKALARVGAELFKEDSIYNTQPMTTNPFDPKSSDMTAAANLVKNDPERAISLIQSLTDPQAKAVWEPQIASIRARVKR